jgi:alpha-amylase
MSNIRLAIGTLFLLTGVLLEPQTSFAQVPGVAQGIPEPDKRNVIVQLFNWRFDDIKAVFPTLKTLGYSHVHVSPPQESNGHVWQWWGRYQPVDFNTIDGPLGSEPAFQQMNAAADTPASKMDIVVDVVLNHTVDINEQPSPPFIVMSGNQVSSETFPQFDPQHFHNQCHITDANLSTYQTCWLGGNLADLKTTDSHVRQVAKNYLKKLANLSADGFRFDAAIHIEPGFYSDVLSAVPGKFAFGEIIKPQPSDFNAWLAIHGMDFYDFPLTKTMREAFAFGGDLRTLKNPKASGQALDGPKAVTFVRNHDIDRGQAGDRGLDPDGTEGLRQMYGIGWDEATDSLNRTDVHLAYAYLFGREDGLPYVFVDMKTLPAGERDDRFDDPFVVAGIRFHNLCLADQGGVPRRKEVWRIETPNTIGWQRGDDRFIVINKAGHWYDINNLNTTLHPGTYTEVRNGWPLHVQPNHTIHHWSVPPRSAMMFVRTGN